MLRDPATNAVTNRERESGRALASSRREFLTTCASGAGFLAVADLLQRETRAADSGRSSATVNPLAPRPPHRAAQAKACIFISLIGGPSQVDLFDPKPKLNELHGQPLPPSLMKETRFAFIERKSAKLMGSPYRFEPHGQCGMELSELLPHLGSCADDIALVRSMHTDHFNHHPAELLMNTGSIEFGRPSAGSWITYGLGSVSENLPGYVVLTCGATSVAGASNWSSGFLPSCYQGIPFRNRGERVLNLQSPDAWGGATVAPTLDGVAALNRIRHATTADPEILSRIASYELAFRMQSTIPQLTDLADEPERTARDYGFMRPIPADLKAWNGGGASTFEDFARNCVTARRLVEQGVRFVSLCHATWDDHLNIDKNLRLSTYCVDQPIAALLKDLKQRGLLDSTLVVCASEFGRTPLGENKLGNTIVTGRDHHPFAFSIWMAGGGVRGGQVFGQTDELGWQVVDKPVHVRDFHATLLHLMGLDQDRLTYRFRGREMRLTDIGGDVVKPLLAT